MHPVQCLQKCLSGLLLIDIRIVDGNQFDSAQKANADAFEEKMFHIIRAFHVAGRCTDCGECSRVCPQGIPLHLFNRKFILDINRFYGEYQAGEDIEKPCPLTDYAPEDIEPGEAQKGDNVCIRLRRNICRHYSGKLPAAGNYICL